MLLPYVLILSRAAGGDQLCGVAGTPLWRAPEVEAGIGYDSAADMYGLGLVLLEEHEHTAE